MSEVIEDTVVDEELFDMDDDALEAAFKAAKAEEVSPDIEDEPVVEDNIEEEEEDIDDDSSDDDDEDLEQPEEDSDDDGTDDDEDDSEEDSDEVDPTEAAKDEEPKEDEDEPEKDVQPVQKLKYKANGKEFEFTQKEVLDQFGQVFGKAMDYTNKTKALAPYRKMVSAMEDEGITQDDMNLMIDVLKGDKDAMASVLKRTGVDALDLDTEAENSYQPNSYGRNETELAIKDVVDEISGDEEYKVTRHVVDKQWDDASREVFVKNPKLIKELHSDVQNGIYDKVSPMALKLKVLDGGSKSDIDYYMAAGQQYYAEQANEQSRQQELVAKEAEMEVAKQEKAKLDKVKADTEKRATTKKASAKRKAAAPTKSRAGKKSVTNYLDDSDEAYDEWYKKLQDKY